MNQSEIDELVARWRSVYNQYLRYLYIDDPAEQEKMWVQTTNSLIEMWHNCNQEQYQHNFSLFLLGQISYYVKLNEYYARFGRQQTIEKNTGGRVWL